jgi:hypothetical protein
MLRGRPAQRPNGEKFAKLSSREPRWNGIRFSEHNSLHWKSGERRRVIGGRAVFSHPSIIHRALAGRGLSTAVLDAAASLVTSGNTSDLASIVSKVPPDEIRTTGQRAYSDGFAAAAFVAAAIASAGCVLPLLLVSGTETGPVEALNLIPCRTFDCRDPL